MSQISKKFTEALKEIKLDDAVPTAADSSSLTGGGMHVGKWIAILVFVVVVILLIAVLMRDTQPKNVVFERLPIQRKQQADEQADTEENSDPNFTLLSSLAP